MSWHGSDVRYSVPKRNIIFPRITRPRFFSAEMSPESPKEVQTATVSEHERKVRQPNALSEIPANLPREERVIDVPEEWEGMILIGYEESERIATPDCMRFISSEPNMPIHQMCCAV